MNKFQYLNKIRVIAFLLTYGVWWYSAHGTVDALIYAIDQGDTASLTSYLKSRGDPNVLDHKGRSLLARASYRGRLTMVNALLKAGASPDYKDPEGFTPLLRVCSSHHEEESDLVAIVEALLSSQKGRSVLNEANSAGATPLHMASQKGLGRVVDKLCSEGAALNSQMLPDPHNSEKKHGETPLWLACYKGLKETVDVLLRYHPQVNLPDYYKVTPLLISCYHGYADIVRSLLREGADPNLLRDNGISPLIVASYHGYEEVVRILLEAGADSQYCSPPEMGSGTAFQYALQEQHEPVINLLYEVNCQQKARHPEEWLFQIERDRARLEALEKDLKDMKKAEQTHATELDALKHTQRSSPFHQKQTIQIEAALEELSRKVRQMELGRPSSQNIKLLKHQLEPLVAEFQKKQAHERQKQQLREHPPVKIFYETTERTLNQFFLAYRVLDTGMVARKGGNLSNVASAINLLGGPYPFHLHPWSRGLFLLV